MIPDSFYINMIPDSIAIKVYFVLKFLNCHGLTAKEMTKHFLSDMRKNVEAVLSSGWIIASSLNIFDNQSDANLSF